MYRKLIFLASLLWCMNVYTMPKPSEVNAAEAHGDFSTAEVLLKQVIAEKPMSSRAHSDLGVLYAREGKPDLATIEANKARQLDTDALAVIESKKILDSKVRSELLYVLFGIPFVGIGIWCLYMLYTRFRKVQKAQDLEILESKGKMIKLLDMIKQLDDSALIAKTATYPDAEKVQIVKLITSLQVQVRNMLADMKDGDNITQNRLSTMKSYVDASVNQAINGLPAAIKQAVDKEEDTTAWGAPRFTGGGDFGGPGYRKYGHTVVHNEPAPTVIHHYHDTAPAQVAPVIVNNSGNDMLTGMMIGEMMSSHNDRTVIVEHDSYERPSRSSRNDDDDSYSSSSSSSSDSYSSSDSSSSSDSY